MRISIVICNKRDKFGSAIVASFIGYLMAQVTGQIDSLRSLINVFKEDEINFFHSLQDITNFKNNYLEIVARRRKEIADVLIAEISQLENSISHLTESYDQNLSANEQELQKEKENIPPHIEQLSIETKNPFQKVYYSYKKYILSKRMKILETDFENEKKKPFKKLEKELNSKNERHSYLKDNFDEIVNERFEEHEKKYTTAKFLLKEYYSLYLGAIGEQKAAEILKTLPDTYHVINGFSLDITPPIFNKNTREYIGSIQADHIVIGPGGVFLIETKNWSNKSMQSRDFYSPVEQLKRTSYILFILLNDADNYSDNFLNHHWGSKKVSVRNILLMINNKPDQEFQYIKILSLNELLGYIKYFKPIYSVDDVQAIYNVFNNLSEY